MTFDSKCIFRLVEYLVTLYKVCVFVLEVTTHSCDPSPYDGQRTSYVFSLS